MSGTDDAPVLPSSSLPILSKYLGQSIDTYTTDYQAKNHSPNDLLFSVSSGHLPEYYGDIWNLHIQKNLEVLQ
jgi:hypothetical protein